MSAMYKPKRLKGSPIDPNKSGMTKDEMNNYNELRRSYGGKKWTPEEARELATNPMGRLKRRPTQ